MPASRPLLGCIADDFTGGTDLSGILVKAGMRTVRWPTMALWFPEPHSTRL